MIDAQLEVQGAIYAALTHDLDVAALVGQRVFDQTPTNEAGAVIAPFPYVSFGPMQSTDDSDTCGDGVVVYAQLDCWSRAVGWPEVKRLAAAVVRVLDSKIAVPGFSVIIHEVERVLSTRERDNRTSRVAVHLKYVLAPSA